MSFSFRLLKALLTVFLISKLLLSKAVIVITTSGKHLHVNITPTLKLEKLEHTNFIAIRLEKAAKQMQL